MPALSGQRLLDPLRYSCTNHNNYKPFYALACETIPPYVLIMENFGVQIQADCPKATRDAERRLRRVGLRPTRQRVSLASLIFQNGDRHLTAEDLHQEAVEAGVNVSLATVYNTLHQFTDANLLRVLALEGSKTFFDTNISDHHHFYVEGENRVMDIASGPITLSSLPEAPEGMEIAHVDVIVRLKKKS